MNRMLLVLATVFLAACGSPKVERRALIDVGEMAGMIESGSLPQIIDVRLEEAFVQGHIPGAVHLWRSDMENRLHELPGMRIEKDHLEQLLSRLGLFDHDSLFLYDAKGNVDAARLWWILRYYGFEKVALIDGGLTKWRMEGLPEEVGEMREKAGKFSFKNKLQDALLATKNDIHSGKYDQIIDARSEEEYNGRVMKNGAIRSGHIPGAVLCDYYQYFSSSDMTIKNKDEVLEMLTQKGLSADKNTAVYCHSGVRSAFTSFVLTEIAGWQDVANYDGSWIEWSSDEDLPIEGNSED
ncbi:MAG: sulfurtransferase [Vicingaceae bacterium]